MQEPSDETLEQARRALFIGDRSKVEERLSAFAASTHAETRWLLASAIEVTSNKDKKDKTALETALKNEAQRIEHLKAVVEIGTPPYADLAKAILEREQKITDEMIRPPWWQRVFVRYRGAFGLVVIMGVIAIGVWVVVGINTAGEQERAASHAIATTVSAAATETATHRPPTPTVTPPFIFSASQPVQYPPFGSLRVLTLEFPTGRVVVNAFNSTTQIPPINSSFAAIAYEFLCTSTDTAFCAAPPEAAVELLLASGQRVPQTQLIIADSNMPPPSVVPTGTSVRSWVVFPVPNGQTPRALILKANTDPSTSDVEEYTVPLSND